MSPLKEIPASAHVAWCPVASHEAYLALGRRNVGGAAFDFVHLDLGSFSKSGYSIPVSVSAGDGTMGCMAWSEPVGDKRLGAVAAGFDNGTLSLWDPEMLLNEANTGGNAATKGRTSGGGSGQSCVLASVQPSQHAATCLAFNPDRPALIACGHSDGGLKIINLENPSAVEIYEPGVEPVKAHGNSSVTAVAWNHSVFHVMASTCANGSTAIWNLRKRKASFTFRDPGGRSRPSSVAWLPNQATQVIVAYDDDTNPSFQMWDLRNASYPFKVDEEACVFHTGCKRKFDIDEFTEHSRGIVDLQFCPLDPSLMMSCGKDNRTLIWSMDEKSGGASTGPTIFSEYTSSEWQCAARWSPCLAGLVASSSHIEGVSVESVQERVNRACRHTPQWWNFEQQAGVAFGFGGKLCSFTATAPTHLSVDVIPSTDPEIIAKADSFEVVSANNDYANYCETKISECTDSHERLTWKAVKTLFYPPEARAPIILDCLGFQQDDILAAVEYFLGRKPGSIVYADHPALVVPDVLSDSQPQTELMRQFPGGASGGAGGPTTASTTAEGESHQHLSARGVVSADASSFGAQGSSARVDAESFFNELGGAMGTAGIDGSRQASLSGADRESEKGGSFDRKRADGGSGGAVMEERKRDDDGSGDVEAKGGKELNAGVLPSAGDSDWGFAGGEETRRGLNNAAFLEGDDEDQGRQETSGRGRKASAGEAVPVDSMRRSDWSKGADLLIKKSFLVGQKLVATEMCIAAGRWADAFLFAATSGDTTLWNRTKELYFQRKKGDTFLQLVNCVIAGRWEELIRVAELSKWQETLALVVSYGPVDVFPSLTEELGYRLEREMFDIRAAVVCYLLAGSFQNASNIWSSLSVSSNRGKSFQKGLQDLVEKLAVLKKATNYQESDPGFSQKISQYADILANSGRLVAGMKFLCFAGLEAENSATAASSLAHRIYYSAPEAMNAAGIPPPSGLPFIMVNVVSNYYPPAPQHQQRPQQHQPGYHHQGGTYGIGGHSPPGYGLSSSTETTSQLYQASLAPSQQHFGSSAQAVASHGGNVRGGAAACTAPRGLYSQRPATLASPAASVMLQGMTQQQPQHQQQQQHQPQQQYRPGATVSGTAGYKAPLNPGLTGATPLGTQHHQSDWGTSPVAPPGPQQRPQGPLFSGGLSANCSATMPTGSQLPATLPNGKAAMSMSQPAIHTGNRSLAPTGPAYNSTIGRPGLPPPPPPHLSAPVSNQATGSYSPNVGQQGSLGASAPSGLAMQGALTAYNSYSALQQEVPPTGKPSARLSAPQPQQQYGGHRGSMPPAPGSTPQENYCSGIATGGLSPGIPQQAGFSGTPGNQMVNHYNGRPNTNEIDGSMPATVPKSTAPAAGVSRIPPGMPVPWPIPTGTQQVGSTTQSTAPANQKIHDYVNAPPSDGVPMSPANLGAVRRVIEAAVEGQRFDDPQSIRKYEDLKAKVGELFTQLQNGGISKQHQDMILQFCQGNGFIWDTAKYC